MENISKDAVGIGGLADEQRLRENDEALRAAYEDEDGPEEEPPEKKVRYAEKDDDDVDEAAEEDQGETRPAKAVKDPGNVTNKEIEQHRVQNHLPFRSWCPYCLAAKAKERAHVKGGAPEEDEDSGVPQFGLDYAFSQKA